MFDFELLMGRSHGCQGRRPSCPTKIERRLEKEEIFIPQASELSKTQRKSGRCVK